MSAGKILSIFSIPRTGTSHLFELLTNVSNLLVLKEVLHPEAAYGFQDHFELLEELSQTMRLPRFDSIFDRDLVNWLRTHPTELLDFLASQSGRVPAFKIFPGHLPIDIIDSVLLQREDIVPALVFRRPIDTYISDIKAMQLSVHREVDTTSVQVILDAGHFVCWWEANRVWYSAITARMKRRGLTPLRLSYEADICGDPRLITWHILSKLKACGLDSGEVRFENVGLFKQDLQPDYGKKVLNWEEFLEYIVVNNHTEKLYGYFLD
ncbi:hypothetical protein [Massilia sp. TS11]|uniref:hypothetical protein n=1 Tax=Massilia sp. TS11 TaxID=2908003 RepID=UPI001EDBD8EA|nr:hypothetical protein [Massilia sp. TS11]MCG2582828.1 hypothetical protein [Massilia sp. TS11]